MSELSELEIHKNSFLLSIKDDVDPLFNQTTMVTETPSTVIVQSPELTPSSTDDGSTVQKFSVDLKKNVEINKNKMSEKFDEMKIKRKRRRRKSKRKSSISLSKTQWKFQVPKIQEKRKQLVMAVGQPIVPYNTNKFLMEDHMPEVTAGKLTPTGRTRESSFSVDSEENYFYSLPEDEEEFLTKEFSSVYEDARSERLDNMSKPQLIQEYLQLESSFDQLSRKFNVKTRNEDISLEFLNKIRLMEEQIKKLNTENIGKRQKTQIIFFYLINYFSPLAHLKNIIARFNFLFKV